MGWAVGWDYNWRRWVGYGVPSLCDEPGCDNRIDRGIDYTCGGGPERGEHGCGLVFCPDHKAFTLCNRCEREGDPTKPKPDTAEWVNHLLTDESWAEWRASNPEAVAFMQTRRNEND